MSTKNWILILSILINICVFIYIFTGIKESEKPDFIHKIDSLQLEIKVDESLKKNLQIKNDSLKEINDSLISVLSIEKKKIKKTIEYKNEKDTIIKSILDGELLELFSKFDTLSNKNK